MQWIEVDEKVYNYLKSHAEPFIDTPNSVLTRLLFGAENQKKSEAVPKVDISGVPKALEQTLEVIYFIKIHGQNRTTATKTVAEKQKTMPQTVMDKYCRQLNLNANQIDQLLSEADLAEFKNILQNKFTGYEDVIEMYIENILAESTSIPHATVKGIPNINDK
jgi:negative regulator of replication initiation